MLTREELPECPVATTVQLIGNKWKLLILRNLIFNGEQRFSDFSKTIPAISKKVLTDNLRALENDGIVNRRVFAEVPPRVVYTLSELGQSLKPLLDAMMVWGNEYKSKL
ncbi:MAG: helix-turn-helix transcriptional regulator [Clostridiales bacterium]|nr:helix-turn-helix transcriptional regulator [Clostridiales bacterium]